MRMRRMVLRSAVMWLTLMLAACPADAPVTTQADPPVVVPGMTDAEVPLSALRPGMAYGELRELVLAAGWSPRPNADCRTESVGDDADAFCAAHRELAVCRICAELPELQACSGDARCLMRFSHRSQHEDLEVAAYGEFDAWKETGTDAGLQVSGWTRVPAVGAGRNP